MSSGQTGMFTHPYRPESSAINKYLGILDTLTHGNVVTAENKILASESTKIRAVAF